MGVERFIPHDDIQIHGVEKGVLQMEYIVYMAQAIKAIKAAAIMVTHADPFLTLFCGTCQYNQIENSGVV